MELNKLFLATMAASSLLLTACGSDSDSDSSDSKAQQDDTGGQDVVTQLNDATWSVGNDAFTALNIARDAGTFGGVVAIKRTPGEEVPNYSLMTASLTNKDFSAYRTFTFNYNATKAADAVAFRVVYGQDSRTLVAQCVSGHSAPEGVTPAELTVSLDNDSSTTVTKELTVQLNGITWQVRDCHSLSDVSLVRTDNEYTLMAATTLARANVKVRPRKEAVAAAEQALIPVSSLLQEDAVVSITIDVDTSADFGPASVDINTPVFVDAGKVIGIQAIAGEGTTAYVATGFDDEPEKVSVLLRHAADGNSTVLNVEANPFNGSSSEYWNVSDMEVVGDKVYLVSDQVAGLIGVDAGHANPAAVTLTDGDYQHCKDVLAYNAATNTLFCHDSTDSGKILEFTPPTIVTPSAAVEAPDTAPDVAPEQAERKLDQRDKPVKEKASKEEAEQIKAELEGAGAEVEVK